MYAEGRRAGSLNDPLELTRIFVFVRVDELKVALYQNLTFTLF